MFGCNRKQHGTEHAFLSWNARAKEGVRLVGRRSTLKAGIAGIAGLSLPALLAAQDQAVAAGKPIARQKSVILLWMTGGPSHIDTWDVKPDAPPEIRGPFGTIATKLPGGRLCEFLPKQAAMMDRLTIIRSVDCRKSNHEPNMVMQTANREAEPRINPEASHYPALASIVARHESKPDLALPPYVVLNMQSRSHVAFAGDLGKRYEPFVAKNVSELLAAHAALDGDRIQSRQNLLKQFDRLRAGLDQDGSMQSLDHYSRQAVEMVTGPRAREAFDLSREPKETLDRYGEHNWARQALLARRLVEAGVSFVTIDLSNHGASGTWDTHGDNIPPYGGIWNGLRPLLPVFDHVLTTLVGDLAERNLLDDVLVIAMGEFGRTPQIGTQGSTDGRNHWPFVMSLTMAGGGLRHGQVIGATERDGGQIKERPVTPSDLAATIFHHFGIPADVQYTDYRGRPRYVLEEKGQALRELL
ncbi:MAG: DUF1501 domain-containing protein [Planctomycetaceae bacterium]|nr:DUF1501 domain-containing protein [Planctomycetaceae bacterium]